jgi:ABC-type branched-subunit amino acid transport system substrate-binding protein
MDAAAAIAGWDRLKSEKAPVVMAQTAATAVLWEMPNRDHIPMVIGGGSSIDAVFPKEPSYLFAVTPALLQLFNSWVKVVANDWAAKGGKGSPKIGFDLVSIGTMPQMFAKNIKMLMEEKGWQYVITRSSIAAADATTQVLQMKNFGCDYAYLYDSETVLIVWMRELDRQNFRPKVTGTSALASEETWRALGPLVVGATMPQFSVQYTETDVAGVKLLHELNAKWHPEVKSRPSHYCRGFAELLVVAEGVDRAVKKAGYEKLTGGDVQQAFETIKDYDPLSMGMGYTWTPTDHQGLHGCRWYQWTKEGTLVPLTGWDVFPPLSPEQRTDAWWMQ